MISVDYRALSKSKPPSFVVFDDRYRLSLPLAGDRAEMSEVRGTVALMTERMFFLRAPSEVRA
ncbi:hypothetical protein [Nocardia goodfellowii]|uniref:Uncharacterized protein n=1 Tax=Nocardia goodfellowii TaxID=882446 RepID=A0ABS4QG42_9NOCA|nr:hypothetical protein [Nocardia goodfellowii]MBP2190665.1 hypothetical protein [Nocardia goodfellowii]